VISSKVVSATAWPRIPLRIAAEKLNAESRAVLKTPPMRCSSRALGAAFRVLGALAALAALAAAGCLDENPGADTKVVTTCAAACAPGTTCQGGACVTNDPTAIGAACTSATDCTDGLCLQSAALQGGYCSKKCGGGVLSIGAVCPLGSQCTQLTEASSVCLRQCSTATDCRPGYVCAADRGPVPVCVPSCLADADCKAPLGCNTGTGVCEAGTHALGRIGGTCAATADCASQKCVTEAASMAQFPGGYCVASCTAADEDKPCPGGDGLCVGLPDSSGTTGYVCLGACTTGVDCRADYMCSADAQVQTSDGTGVCIPRCEHFECTTGFTCDRAVGICTMGTEMNGTAGVVDESLGNATVGSAAAAWKTLTIKVDPGEVSFTLVAKAAVASAEVSLVKVTAPNGKVVFDHFDPLVTDFHEPSPLFSGSLISMYPNAPRVNIVPGNYSVVIGATATIDVKLDVLHKRQSGVPQGGTLPVVFWFTNQKYLNATTAKTDPRFAEVVAVFTQIYAAVGIKVGPFTYVDLPQPAADSYAVIDDFDKLAGLFATADGSAVKGLHFFMIDQFNLEGGSGIIGISGGVPGPPAFPGLPHGGVAVALSGLNDTGVLAETMAHEGGHFLGLYHTTERDGLSFDPLLDTPECPISQDRNNDKVVTGAECGGFGSENLMFWSTAPVPQRTLTSDQRFVLLRNPVLQ
jgi:hypothetical protein